MVARGRPAPSPAPFARTARRRTVPVATRRASPASTHAPETRRSGTAPSLVPLAALAFTAAAFTAMLFLLVIELVAGFAISPLRAALGVTVLPLAALAAAAITGPPRSRALAGAVLLAGGAAALAFLPAAGIAWTIVPQLLAGAGMGLALPAYSRRAAARAQRRRGRAGARRAPRRDRRRARDPRPGGDAQARRDDRAGDPAGRGARARRPDRPAAEARARARAVRGRRRRPPARRAAGRRRAPARASSPTTPRSTTGSPGASTTSSSSPSRTRSRPPT